MPDDEVRTPPDPRFAGQATPNRGKRREPPLIDGSAEEVLPNPVDDREPDFSEASLGASRTALEPHAADPAVQEPSMAAGAAELTAAEGAAEATQAEHSPERLATDPAIASSPSTARGFAEAKADRSEAPRRSRLPLLLSGLGLLLVLLLGAVLYALYNPPTNDAVAGLTNDVTTLKQRVAALDAKPVPQPNLNPLQDRVAALEAKPAAAAPDVKPLQDRIAALEAVSGQVKNDLDDLRGKLNAQGAAAAPEQAASSPSAPVDLGPLQRKVADLDGSLKALQIVVASLPKVDLAPLDSKVTDLGQSLAKVQTAVANLPRVDLTPLNGKLEDLDRRLTPIEAELAAPKTSAQVTEVRRNGSAAETRAAPLVVTAQTILQAIDDGRPFAPAVVALQSLGTDDNTLAPLRALAEKGAPTRAELLSEFDGLKGRMVGAGTPMGTGGLLDRLIGSAQSLVKVRPTGANPGQDPDAVVSRIADALQRDDLRTALAEWQGLPGDGRAASQAWADRLKARLEAEEAARSIETGAIAMLGSKQ